MIITVSSMKGGVGKTETALNLSVALKKTGKRVVLIDFDIPYGGVAQALGESKEVSISDWLETTRNVSTKALKSMIAIHQTTGLHYIPAISNVHDANRIKSGTVQRIIAHLNQIYDYIVIDSGVDFGALTKEALKLSDKIIIVTTPSNVSAQNNFRYKEDLADLGIQPEKLLLFVNMVHEKRAASIVLEKVVETFQESGVPVETVAACYYDDKIMKIRDSKGIVYTKNRNANFSKGIDEIIDALGAGSPDFSTSDRKGLFDLVKGLFAR